MRGNVVRVTIGDYIYRMPGFLDSVNVTIDNSNTPWEILLGQWTDSLAIPDGDVRQLPHMVTVQCSFKPIMDSLPRKESYSSPFVPLIVNRDHYLDLAATDDNLRSIPSRNTLPIQRDTRIAQQSVGNNNLNTIA